MGPGSAAQRGANTRAARSADPSASSSIGGTSMGGKFCRSGINCRGEWTVRGTKTPYSTGFFAVARRLLINWCRSNSRAMRHFSEFRYAARPWRRVVRNRRLQVADPNESEIVVSASHRLYPELDEPVRCFQQYLDFGQPGPGGTNTAQADDVFSKMDKNGDGSVSLDEMSSALKGGGHHHHHHVADGSSGSSATDGSSSTSGSSSDPLLQALDGATSTSTTNSDGSTTTSMTYADGSKVTMTMPATTSSASATSSGSATSSYNIIEQMIQRQAQAISSGATSSLSMRV